MSPIFLATVGQRPTAITVALEVLRKQYDYEQIGFIVTDPVKSDISDDYQELMNIVRSQYDGLHIVEHIVYESENKPLLDITNAYSAEQYFLSVLGILKRYREQGINIHFLVAGGRKAMSIYATLAASLLFGEMDHVYTVLSSPEIIKGRHFNIPQGRHDEVQIVHLPTLPSRFLPNILADLELSEILDGMRNPRDRFLNDLSPKEHKVAETVYEHQYASYQELANILGTSPRTVENQLSSIYSKMLPYFDLQRNKQKKNALIDIMAGRI